MAERQPSTLEIKYAVVCKMTAIDDTAEALPDIDFTVDQWLSQQPSVNQAGSVDGCPHPPIGVSSNNYLTAKVLVRVQSDGWLTELKC